MTTETATLFFALLAILAQVTVVTIVVLSLLSLVSPTVRTWWRNTRVGLAPQVVPMAAVVALVSTGGSLYLSEVAGFHPCRLCWYQRYAMYPLVLVLGLAAALRSAVLRWVGMAVALVGGSISIYHMVVERYPTLESTACDPFNPCSIIWVEEFGYLTIPTMALSGFALIFALLAIAHTAQEAP